MEGLTEAKYDRQSWQEAKIDRLVYKPCGHLALQQNHSPGTVPALQDPLKYYGPASLPSAVTVPNQENGGGSAFSLTLKVPITTVADDVHKYIFIVFQRK